MGAPAADKPRAEDIAASELDEDYSPPTEQYDDVRQVGGPAAREVDREPTASESGRDSDEYGAGEPFDAGTLPPPPFADLPPLPADLADAFESFKLAILRHKLAGWAEVSRDDVVAALTSLERLATNG